jgi:uncharacterized protein YkwD
MIVKLATRAALAAAVTGIAAALAACSGSGVGQALSPTLTASMDQPGAALNRVDAIYLVNDYRQTQGARPLRGDTILESSAQALAASYAKSGVAPALPKGIDQMLVSAGYTTFAETFSGWRNSPNEAAILADATMSRAGIGVAYDAGSASGVHWVLLLGR